MNKVENIDRGPVWPRPSIIPPKRALILMGGGIEAAAFLIFRCYFSTA